MKLSVIIPAFNEEKLIGSTIVAIQNAFLANEAIGFDGEIIAVDNNSTDRTAELAEKAGATVVFESINQISRARNAGASNATGDWLLFVDADSEPSAALFADLMRLIIKGLHVGCGSVVWMEDLPLWGRMVMWIQARISVMFGWAAGSFLACRADAFREIGGFSEELFASEEVEFCDRLKVWGRKSNLRFVVLRKHPMKTSNRKMKLYSGREMLRELFGLMIRGRSGMKDKKNLDMWYGGRR